MFECGQEDAMCACGGQRTVFSRFFFHLLGSGEQNELVRFSRKHFYLLSYLYYLRKKIVKICFITFLFMHLNVAGAHIGVMWWPEDTFLGISSFLPQCKFWVELRSSDLMTRAFTHWAYQSRRSFLAGVLCLMQGLTYAAQTRLFINFSALTSLVLLGLQL